MAFDQSNLNRLTTVLTTTVTTVTPSASTSSAWNPCYGAWSGHLPAPGSVGVCGVSPTAYPLLDHHLTVSF